MCAVFTSLGSVSAYMLLTLLLVSAAGGDWVTTQQCQNLGRPGRVRHYQEDRNASTLWLSNCNIDEINEDDIIGLPNITALYLDHNAISQIDLAVFSHVPKLEYLTLHKNKLRELPVFPKNSCSNLIELKLSENQLTTLNNAETFSACTQLKYLSLDNNKLHDIHLDVFSSLTGLEILFLHNNNLELISDQMFAQNMRLRQLWINNNRLTYLPQDFASSFKRRGLGLDRFHFYENPWRCACLLELQADVDRAGVLYYDYWRTYDGTQPACVYTGAVPCCRLPSGLLPPPRATTGGRKSSRLH